MREAVKWASSIHGDGKEPIDSLPELSLLDELLWSSLQYCSLIHGAVASFRMLYRRAVSRMENVVALPSHHL
jgi:hypothetical protein